MDFENVPLANVLQVLFRAFALGNAALGQCSPH